MQEMVVLEEIAVLEALEVLVMTPMLAQIALSLLIN